MHKTNKLLLILSVNYRYGFFVPEQATQQAYSDIKPIMQISVLTHRRVNKNYTIILFDFHAVTLLIFNNNSQSKKSNVFLKCFLYAQTTTVAQDYLHLPHKVS